MQRVRNHLSPFRPRLLNPVSLPLRKRRQALFGRASFEFARGYRAPPSIPERQSAFRTWPKVTRSDRTGFFGRAPRPKPVTSLTRNDFWSPTAAEKSGRTGRPMAANC